VIQMRQAKRFIPANLKRSLEKCLLIFSSMGVLTVSTQGCVTKSDHAELVKKNEQLTGEVEDLQKELRLLKDGSAVAKELDRVKRDNARLRKERDSLNEQVKALTDPKSKPFGVIVVAPSVSTSIEARLILRKQGWVETSLRDASAALVVVRSMLFDPLQFTYASFGELERDAESQLNIIGQDFHVYVYSLDDNLRPVQLQHVSYKADDF